MGMCAGQSILKSDDKEWFFFCPRDLKHPSSSRLNRATRKGFWKTTGKDRTIKSKKNVIGMKKSLVFHTGRAHNSQRTYWVMHEYRTTSKELDGSHPGQRPFVLCRLFKKDDEFVQDATENDAELPSPSPTPNEHSPINSNPELVSQQVVPFAGQECTEKFSSAENLNDVDDCCKTPSQETVSNAKRHVECHPADSEDLENILKSMEKQPQTDVFFDYDELFADPDPNDMFLFDSTTPESMGSSLIQHSTNSDFFVNESLRLDDNENELDQCTCDVLQSLLANSPDNSCEDQGNNLISIDDYEIPNERMSLFDDDTPGIIIAASWNTDETEQMVVKYGQCVTSFQELDKSATRPVYRGGAFSSGSVSDYCATSDNQVSNSYGNVSNPDQVCHSGIQIQRRQPQVGLAIDNNDKQGIAQRRINLQVNLQRRFTHDSEQLDTYDKQVLQYGGTTLQADFGTESDDEWRGFTHDSEQPDAYYKHVLQNGGTILQADFGTEPDVEWTGQSVTYNEPERVQSLNVPQAESRTESDDNRNVSKKFINENLMLIDEHELQGYCGTESDDEQNIFNRFIPKKRVFIGQGPVPDSHTLVADYSADSDDEWRGFRHDSEQPDTYNKQVRVTLHSAGFGTESDDNRNVSKKFISSVISSFKPSQLRISFKLMIGLTSVVTILIAYAGFRGYLSVR